MPRESYYAPLIERLFDRVDVRGLDQCWPWQGYIANTGYGQIGRGGRAEGLESTHRAVLLYYYGATKLLALHTCDFKPCCNPRHIYPGDKKQNAEDARKHGKLAVGQRAGPVKLTNAQARYVKRTKRSTRELADKYKVGTEAIRRIRTGERWAHL